MKVARINPNGLEQISAALAKHHVLGAEHFTSPMVGAWAAEAEQSFDNGNGCQFEIAARQSITGAPVIVPITSEGFDVEEFCEE